MADTTRFPGLGLGHWAAAALLGAVLGLLGAKYVLVGSGWSLLPWGLVALLVGFTAGSRRRAAVDAGIYGFALSFVFMVAGYSGAAPLAGRLWFFVLLGLFGAACAALIAVVGRQVHSWLTRRRDRSPASDRRPG
jgi:hypothetical protein